MSAEATAAVFRLKFSNPSARLVLMSLADHHNRSTGMCFPAVKTLIADTCLGRATVFRALLWLELNGLIKRWAEFELSGRQKASEYSLLFLQGEGSQPETGRVSSRDGGGSQPETGEGLNGETPNTNWKKELEEGTPPTPKADVCQGNNQTSKKGKEAQQKEGLTSAEGKLGEPELVLLAKQALSAYNERAEKLGLPIAARLNKFRMRIVNRVEEAGGMEAFIKALDNIEKSPFLLGHTARDGWRATFDFICQETSFTRLMEGFYTPAKAAGNTANGRYYAPGTF
jgi:hypothetical protein